MREYLNEGMSRLLIIAKKSLAPVSMLTSKEADIEVVGSDALRVCKEECWSLLAREEISAGRRPRCRVAGLQACSPATQYLNFHIRCWRVLQLQIQRSLCL